MRVSLWDETALELAWRKKAKEVRDFANRTNMGRPTPASPCRSVEITDELRAKYNKPGVR